MESLRLEALHLGGRLLGWIGLLGGAASGLVFVANRQPNMQAAAIIGGFVGVIGWALARAANAGRSRLANLLLVSTVFVPSIAHWPLGRVDATGHAAALLSAWLLGYGMAVTFSGLLLRPWLSVLSGALAAVQLLVAYVLVRPDLQRLPLSGLVRNVLVEPAPWAFRSVYLLWTGMAAGLSALIARRLVTELLREQRESLAVSRLFGEFVSVEVRDKILKDRRELRAERTEAAVLFADIRGFTGWSERTSPVEVAARLNRYFGAMVEAIEREGGVVDKFIGDAVMATFGGLVPLEKPADAAIRAALAMQTSLAQLNAEWSEQGHAPFDAGIGISYGPVLHGPLGSERRRDFTVIGDVVNIASRVEQLTKVVPYRVLCTRGLVEALDTERARPLVDLGHRDLSGRADPVNIFALGQSQAERDTA